MPSSDQFYLSLSTLVRLRALSDPGLLRPVRSFFLGLRMRCKQAATKGSETGELSLEELAEIDAKESRAGYIALQGSIYDINNSSNWKDGIHIGRHLAGGDLTEMLGQLPHGEAQVLAMPQIGKLRDDEPVGLPLSAKAFLHHGLYEPGFCAVDHLNCCVLEMVVAVSFLSYAIILCH